MPGSPMPGSPIIYWWGGVGTYMMNGDNLPYFKHVFSPKCDLNCKHWDNYNKFCQECQLFFPHYYSLPYSSQEMLDVVNSCDVVIVGFKFYIDGWFLCSEKMQKQND